MYMPGAAEVYRIEDDFRGRMREERHAVRQEKSRPIVDDHAPWLTEQLARISQKTKLARTGHYTLSRWDGLARSIDDGRFEVDSNTVGRSCHQVDSSQSEKRVVRKVPMPAMSIGRPLN